MDLPSDEDFEARVENSVRILRKMIRNIDEALVFLVSKEQEYENNKGAFIDQQEAEIAEIISIGAYGDDYIAIQIGLERLDKKRRVRRGWRRFR